MSADGRIQYEGGSELTKYALPIKTPNRNFPQVEKNQWYSLGDLQSGDYAGNTETDSATEQSSDHRNKGEQGGGGYTSINYKAKGKSMIKNKSSAKKGK